ncbi:hypothetical protein [Agromyces sp. CF514]|uniref:hypothetical protein n=1 Tax=Agromyces sp. CF514 TaxID=1881031 RepID=UPI001160DB19|nr:hypothetical protein [Agromyces sp. CF514]
MLANSSALVGADRPTAGPVSLAQGVYGARGNLELLACDADDGLWVFWFNADLDSDPLETPDVPPGSWSAGLHFAAGHRYVDALIVQSTLGPDHLEVLALDADGVLQSWYWSPGPGFQRRETDAATHVVRFAAVHAVGVLRLTVEGAEGDAHHLVSTAAGYPERSWAPTATGAPLADEASARALIEAAGAASVGIAPGTARTAASTRDGGTTELTWRDDAGRIRHLGVPTRA